MRKSRRENQWRQRKVDNLNVQHRCENVPCKHFNEKIFKQKTDICAILKEILTCVIE